jgi:transposase
MDSNTKLWPLHKLADPKLRFEGKIKVDASYFGGRRKGMFDAKADTWLPIIRQKVQPDSTVYTDTFRSYNTLDVSEFKHDRINHSELLADKQNYTK